MSNQPDVRTLMEFMKHTREALHAEMEKISLTLLEMDLCEGSSSIITPGVENWYYLKGRVAHPLTKEVKGFRVKIGANISKTEREDVEPMVRDMAAQIRMSFFPTVH